MPNLQSQNLRHPQIRHIYEIQLHRYTAMNSQMLIRIQSKWPKVPWPLVWKNIHTRTLPQEIKTTLNAIIHDVVSTNHRLHAINLHETDKCNHCQQTDTLLHRYTSCTDVSCIWSWTRQSIACFLRIQSQYVPEEWLTAPAFKIYPLQRHNATVCLLGHTLHYIHTNRLLTLDDYLDFLRRARWKQYSERGGYKTCGCYLEVIDY